MRNETSIVSYNISNLGLLEQKKEGPFSLLEIANYSLEGDLYITANEAKLTLAEIPLLEAFHAIRQILKIVPIFTKSCPYTQMFREAKTSFSVEGDTLLIEHTEIPQLRARSGSLSLKINYVTFCSEFGSTAKKFVGELESIAPSLFKDETIAASFSDLFVCSKIKDSDDNVYSII